MVQSLSAETLLYNWDPTATSSPISLMDESFRDGIQAPSATDPTIEDKLQILHQLDALGVQSINLGNPSISYRAFDHTARLVQEIANQELKIQPACMARMTETDIRRILDIAQSTEISLEIMLGVHASSLTRVIGNYSLETLADQTSKAVQLAISSYHSVTLVIEEATRSHPDTLKRLIQVAVEAGVTRICLCDSAGVASPHAVHQIVGFVQTILQSCTESVAIDWHGRNDRGLALANALAAADVGVDRLHGSLLGLGDRSGSTALDQLLINLKWQNRWDPELHSLLNLCQFTSEAFDIPVPAYYPGVGQDAFRTGNGLDATAYLKAANTAETKPLADLVYSGLPAQMMGRTPEIAISHQSGAANILCWFQQQGIMPDPKAINAVLGLAKTTDRALTDQEIRTTIEHHTQVISS